MDQANIQMRVSGYVSNAPRPRHPRSPMHWIIKAFAMDKHVASIAKSLPRQEGVLEATALTASALRPSQMFSCSG